MSFTHTNNADPWKIVLDSFSGISSCATETGTYHMRLSGYIITKFGDYMLPPHTGITSDPVNYAILNSRNEDAAVLAQEIQSVDQSGSILLSQRVTNGVDTFSR